MSTDFEADVAIVGGGPAGAAVAAHLAAAGVDVALFERLPRPVWRACGVYSSPLTRVRLARLGLSPAQLDALIRPIAAMSVETADGSAQCRLDYPPPHAACGVDRVRLERALLDLIRGRAVRVFEGAVVRSVEIGRSVQRLTVSRADGVSVWTTRVVVGADGPNSIVARTAGVHRGARYFRRAALTGHRAMAQETARLVIGPGWYMGIAPVPGDRVNLGLVMSEAALRRQLRMRRPADVVADAVDRVPANSALRKAPPTDAITTHLPLWHGVRRAAGDGFVLAGDAAGFVDPLSGEGLHRALVSAELAAAAVRRMLAGDGGAAEEYHRRLRARFTSKDCLSWALQVFTLQPLLARRAITRLDRQAHLRETFAAALADLTPASAVFDPRFVGRLLA